MAKKRKKRTALSPEKLAEIRANIFEGAHGAIENWAEFSWHQDRKVVTAGRRNSSQALCISVWGTFASKQGEAVRWIVGELLGDLDFVHALPEIVDRAAPLAAGRRPIGLALEYWCETLLNEAGGGRPSNLDAVLTFRTLGVVIESKLGEELGCCSQAEMKDRNCCPTLDRKHKHCTGVYEPGSDLKEATRDRNRDVSCRLSASDRAGRRATTGP